MDVPVAEWLSLILRWLHVIFGAAWIGTSFYFNWLNNHVRPVEDGPAPQGVAGELWQVHGGKFYQVVKYSVAPPRLPRTLHWFKYEAYFTWVTGFFLLAIVYYLEPTAYLVDANVPLLRTLLPEGMVQIGAVAIGVLVLLGGWLVYHLMCKSPLGRMPVAFAVVGFALMTGVAFGLTQIFGSRAAYIHVGALLGTIMAWNVFFVIIPNQKRVVAAMSAGKEPDAKLGEDAAQRSLHNNYFTLPVLFIMVSNHYPMTFGHEYNWAVLAALSLIGAGVRHWFNLRGRGHRNVWILPAAAVAIVGLALVSSPRSAARYEGEVTFAMVRDIIERRCVECHSATPTSELYDTAPQGVMFDTPQQIVDRAARINAQVVVTQQMPLSNLTGMTEEERAIIAAWYQRGARLE
ncbi:MAG TPA: urate hydroxylase PuuD [Sandaracinaceae bacterium]